MPIPPKIDEALRSLLAVSLLFWAFIYAVMTVRGVLQPDPLPVFSARRLVSTVSGTLLFVAAALWLGRRRRRSHAELAGLIGALSVAAAIVLFGVQAAAEWLVEWEPRITAAGQASWLLMWMGYFAAWLAGTLFLRRPRAARGDGNQEEAGEAGEAAAATPAPPEPVIWVQQNRRSIRLPLTDIEWAEAEGNYVRLHSPAGGGLVRSSLTGMEHRLASEGFVRVHRSALCRKAAIRGLDRSGSVPHVVLASGAQVPVGRRFAAGLLDELGA